MVCFDYEVVQCSVCGERTQDGYQMVDDKVVCDECAAKTPKQENDETPDKDEGQLPWPSEDEAKLLCADCLKRFREWDRRDLFEPCPKCQAELDDQMAPGLVRIWMPGENRPEGKGRSDGSDTMRSPSSVLDGSHKTAGQRQD